MDQTTLSLKLNTGAQIPAVGLGVWKIEKSATADVIKEAIRVGYRHLDCACDYGNEKEVGDGIRAAIQEGLCTREELWVTSKLWNTYHAAEHVPQALERSLNDLGLDYVDLYLVHFPIALEFVPFETRYPPEWTFDPAVETPCLAPVDISIQETWTAMEALADSGKAKNIGICNFTCSLLRDLLAYCKIEPALLQVELHPYLTQPKLIKFCHSRGIAVTGFSPLGALSYLSIDMAEPSDSVLIQEVIKNIAGQHQKTPAQIVLRWGVQRGTAVIPKTSTPARLVENLSIFDFELTEEEMNQIDGLDCHRRFNDPGAFCEPAFGTFFPIFD
ncbi:MAG: aldo/keto reductase [Pirellulales bacterium]